MVIGVSGVAGAGKDTFFEIFENLLGYKRRIRRFALADALKDECSTWTLPNYGIDARTCSRENKELIRPFLVLHAKFKREESKGRHWLEKIYYDISSYKNSNDIALITDIRYNEYDKDEVSWLKNELNGILLHVSMYTAIPDPNEGALILHFKKPCNEEEEKNDPLVKKAADYRLEWPKIENDPNFKKKLVPYVQKFIDENNI